MILLLVLLFLTLPLPGLLDLFQIQFDEGGHFRRLPVGLFGIFGPNKGKVQDFAWFFCLLQKGEGP